MNQELVDYVINGRRAIDEVINLGFVAWQGAPIRNLTGDRL
jgi:hypothetical protein